MQLAAILERTTLFAFCLFAATPTEACQIGKGQNYTAFQQADIIVRAKITGYENQPSRYRAVFHLETDEKIILVRSDSTRARATRKWVAFWTNSTYGEPENWTESTRVIVGLKAVLDRDGSPSVEVSQQSCGPPSILEDTPENLKAVLAAIAPK